jgi:SAM-dependent methyltransferase
MSDKARSPEKKLHESLFATLEHLPSTGRLSRIRVRSARWLEDRIFERGVDTAQPEVELDHFHPDRTHYLPSGWRDLRRALPRGEVEPTDVFADLGSGKGRVVYEAAKYPFARVIGVEISPKLNEIARRNVERNRHKLACRDVELVTADAADFAIPEDLTIVYLYHPFGGETFEKVLGNIVGSLDRKPRPLRLIYQLPLNEDRILATGRFELVGTPVTRPARRIAVYASTPTGDTQHRRKTRYAGTAAGGDAPPTETGS